MNSAQPKILALIAVALFAYIVAFEWTEPVGSGDGNERGLLLPGLNPSAVTGLEFQTQGKSVVAERTQDDWVLKGPVAGRANIIAIQSLLAECLTLNVSATIPLEKIENLADYGLEQPQGKLTISQGDQVFKVQIGARAPINNQLYVLAEGQDFIAAVSAEVFALLPFDRNLWRDRNLMDLAALSFDRVRIRHQTRLLQMERETNRPVWRIVQPPPPKRGNGPRIEQLLQQWQRWPIYSFVTDEPAANLALYGLDKPDVELSFADGTNQLLTVQFGSTPSNRQDLVYARLPAENSVVLAAAELLPYLKANYWEYCDHRLLDNETEGRVNRIEIRGSENFALVQNTNLLWYADNPQRTLIDSALMLHFIDNLAALEAVELAKEVVTDFAEYGLEKPQRTYRLIQSLTNASGAVTNHLVAQVDFGSNRVDRTFARRHDENAVYVVPRPGLERLPESLYQIQNRIVWSFQTNQVRGVTIYEGGKVRQLTREPMGTWLEIGETNIVKLPQLESSAIEEGIVRLGLLQADAWVDRGADRLRLYGINSKTRKISIELSGPTPRTLILLLGRHVPDRKPYAAYLSPVDQQPIIFEFSPRLYLEFIEPFFRVREP